MGTHDVVVVGGGFAGLTATKKLRRAPVRVTLVDRRNHHLFQPLLYQVATGGLSPANIAAPLRTVLKRQRNARVLLAEAVEVDPQSRRLILTDGTIAYDTLIIATGVGHHYFGHDAWEEWAPGLKTIEDATRIRARILSAFERAERESDPDRRRALLNFVIVGGGPTGVELAGALAEIARDTLTAEFRAIDPSLAQVLLVEGEDRVLPGYPRALSDHAARSLEKLRVDVRTGSMVTQVSADGVVITQGSLHQTVATRTVLWAAGVKASPLGSSLAARVPLDLDRSGRVKVNADLTVPGHPEIFVLGDLAHCAGPNGESLPGVAQVAMQQGAFAAGLIADRLRGRGGAAAFRYRDLGTMATIGRHAAVAELFGLRLHGYPAWLIWLFVHLMKMVTFENRLLVFVQWAWNYVTFNRSARLITATPRNWSQSDARKDVDG